MAPLMSRDEWLHGHSPIPFEQSSATDANGPPIALALITFWLRQRSRDWCGTKQGWQERESRQTVVGDVEVATERLDLFGLTVCTPFVSLVVTSPLESPPPSSIELLQLLSQSFISVGPLPFSWF